MDQNSLPTQNGSEEPTTLECDKLWIPGTRWSFRVAGDGYGAVLLDSGYANPDAVWASVVEEVAARARVITVDRTSSLPEDREEVDAHLRAYLDHLTAMGGQRGAAEPRILVGWDVGAIFVQLLMANCTGLPVYGVLIDPLPQLQIPGLVASDRGDLAGMKHLPALAESMLRPGGAGPSGLDVSDQAVAPVTYIIPGSQSHDGWIQERRRLLYEEISQLKHVREVIAGRSQHRIPTERPDVVIDTIIGYLHQDQ